LLRPLIAQRLNRTADTTYTCTILRPPFGDDGTAAPPTAVARMPRRRSRAVDVRSARRRRIESFADDVLLDEVRVSSSVKAIEAIAAKSNLDAETKRLVDDVVTRAK
jgi:hypothetical protein